MTDTNAVDKKIDEIAEILKDAVAEIESTPVPVTRNNYGSYMALFSMFCDDIGQAKLMAEGLIRAGANEFGVRDALKCSF